MNESRGPKIRERWPAQFDIMGIERDTQVRTQLKQQMLEETMTAPVSNNFTAGNPAYRDLSRAHPMPYVYREYPKTMYHPTQKTNKSILAREKAETHNQLHPDKPELVPDLEVVSIIVQDKDEENAAIERGYQLGAPKSEAEMTEEEIEAQEKPMVLCDFCGRPKHKGRCKKVG